MIITTVRNPIWKIRLCSSAQTPRKLEMSPSPERQSEERIMFGIQKHLCLMLRWVKIRCSLFASANVVEERDRRDEQGRWQIKITGSRCRSGCYLMLHCTLQPWSNHSFRFFHCSQNRFLTNTRFILCHGQNPKNWTCQEPSELGKTAKFINVKTETSSGQRNTIRWPSCVGKRGAVTGSRRHQPWRCCGCSWQRHRHLLQALQSFHQMIYFKWSSSPIPPARADSLLWF